MKRWAERFYKSKRWQRCREYVWQRDKGLCQICLNKGIITPGSTVHHIIELTQENINDEAVSLNPDNLVTVCMDCHAAAHKNPRRYTVDELGRVSVLPPGTGEE